MTNEIGRRVILLMGGVRSGKSALAERLALGLGNKVAVLVTAAGGDAEMRRRIAKHLLARPSNWLTVEEQLHPSHVLPRLAEDYQVIVVDCLTLLVSNYLCHTDMPRAEQDLSLEIEAMLDAMDKSHAGFVLVSNEVGMGVVPPYELGREYRDVLGRVNQTVASRADEVYLLVAGIPIELKRLSNVLLEKRPDNRSQQVD
jgi:adenosylcobinamide kinase / adenosylcobinamide-phosphate guanylyltransferase